MTITFHPSAAISLGALPLFMSPDDPRPAREQIDANYQFGGGWQAIPGFGMDPVTGIMHYPGDPAFFPTAIAVLHDEVIRFYPGSWVSILHTDGSYEVARID